MKSFDELMRDNGFEDCEDPGGDCFDEQKEGLLKEETDEEVEIRAEVFLNGYRTAEDSQRKLINNLSFQLNKRFVEGCQGLELIQFYNEGIGRLLDDFIF